MSGAVLVVERRSPQSLRIFKRDRGPATEDRLDELVDDEKEGNPSEKASDFEKAETVQARPPS